MKKKLLSILLIVILVLSLAGCSANKNEVLQLSYLEKQISTFNEEIENVRSDISSYGIFGEEALCSKYSDIQKRYEDIIKTFEDIELKNEDTIKFKEDYLKCLSNIVETYGNIDMAYKNDNDNSIKDFMSDLDVSLSEIESLNSKLVELKENYKITDNDTLSEDMKKSLDISKIINIDLEKEIENYIKIKDKYFFYGIYMYNYMDDTNILVEINDKEIIFSDELGSEQKRFTYEILNVDEEFAELQFPDDSSLCIYPTINRDEYAFYDYVSVAYVEDVSKASDNNYLECFNNIVQNNENSSYYNDNLTYMGEFLTIDTDGKAYKLVIDDFNISMYGEDVIMQELPYELIDAICDEFGNNYFKLYDMEGDTWAISMVSPISGYFGLSEYFYGYDTYDKGSDYILMLNTYNISESVQKKLYEHLSTFE